MNRRAPSWLPSDWTICSSSSNKTTSVRNPGREWGNSPAVRSPSAEPGLAVRCFSHGVGPRGLVPSSMNMVSPPVIPTDGAVRTVRGPGVTGWLAHLRQRRGCARRRSGSTRRPRAGPVGWAPSDSTATARRRRRRPPPFQPVRAGYRERLLSDLSSHAPRCGSEIMYQLRIGLISFPLQFQPGAPRKPDFRPGLCAMLEFGCPPGGSGPGAPRAKKGQPPAVHAAHKTDHPRPAWRGTRRDSSIRQA